MADYQQLNIKLVIAYFKLLTFDPFTCIIGYNKLF